MPVIKSSSIFPEHDNLYFHLPNYLFFSNSFLHRFGIPLWYPANGGVPIGITSISLFPLVPHRLIGYLLYVFFPKEPLVMYKVTLICGMLLVSIGWWFFLFKITYSKPAATFGTLMILLGGTGITIFHQEQILATITWIPWILLTLTRVTKEIKSILILFVLLGFSVTIHYPQIQLILFSSVFFALTLTGKINLVYPLNVKKIFLLLLAIALFILAASPLLYIYNNKDDLSSPVRKNEGIKIESLSDYVRINKMQNSSADFFYLKNYIRPQVNIPDDQFVFFVTITGIIFAVIGLIFQFKMAIYGVTILFFCIWAALGVNGYFAQLLYLVNFPFIVYFRQWYHFVPIVNLCLSFLGALGFSSFLVFFSQKIKSRKKMLKNLVKGILIGSIFILMIYEGERYLGYYIKNHLSRVSVKILRFNRSSFLSLLKTGWISQDWIEKNLRIFSSNPFYYPLITYTDWFKLSKLLDTDKYKVPFAVTLIYNDIALSGVSKDRTLKSFCDSGVHEYGAFATVHFDRLEELNRSFPKICVLKKDTLFSDLNKSESVKNLFFSKENYVITPKGAHLRGSIQSASLVVFPFAYKLDLRAYLNSEKVETYSIFNGAMTGIIVPKGEFYIDLIMPLSAYQFTLLIQTVLLVFVFVFSFYLYRRKRFSTNGIRISGMDERD